MSSFNNVERKKNMIKCAIHKWTKIPISEINVAHISGQGANFYRVSANIKNAKWLTTVDFQLHKDSELETMKTLKREIEEVF